MATTTRRTSGDNSNVIAAVAYVLGLITGIIVYLVKKDDSYARFHAVQSILWSLSLWALQMILFITVVGIVLVPIILLVAFASWLWLIYKALSGERYKLPVIGEWAEKYA